MRGGACRWARRYKWQYLDGLLPAAKQARVEQHLQVCLPCRAEFALAQEAIEALRVGKPLTSEQQRLLARPRTPATLVHIAVVLIAVLVVSAGAYWWQTQGGALKMPLELISKRVHAGAAAASSTIAPTEAANPQLSPTLPIATPPLEPRPLEAAPQLSQQMRPPKPPRPALSRRLPSRRSRQSPTFVAPSPTLPAEGVVEVYDASGALIKRQRLPRQ
ncbi:MAG: anti-sigma factor [Armatimonadota bacterium]|nr:anti-sigma factor [Armatimonadota bacterium]